VEVCSNLAGQKMDRSKYLNHYCSKAFLCSFQQPCLEPRIDTSFSGDGSSQYGGWHYGLAFVDTGAVDARERLPIVVAVSYEEK
jgi:hypothetical protein